MRELVPGIFLVETDYAEVSDFPLWLYLVDGGDGLALLDTGVPSTLDRTLRGELTVAGYEPSDVAIVFNSHGHPDHMGGNAAVLAESDAAVHAPLGEAVWIEDHERHWREVWARYPGALDFDEARHHATMERFCGPPTRVDHVLRDGDVLEVGSKRLQVIATKGHSPDHLALFEPDSGILFTFDDVQGAGTSRLTADELVAPLYNDPDEYVAGLRRLRDLPFTMLCGSLRVPVGRDEGLALIDESVAWTRGVEELVVTLLDELRPLTTAAVAHAIGTRIGNYSGITLQTAHVAHAHLTRLARAGSLAPAWVARSSSASLDS